MLEERVWSPLICLQSKATIVAESLPNQTLGDCFTPYSDRFSLHTKF